MIPKLSSFGVFSSLITLIRDSGPIFRIFLAKIIDFYFFLVLFWERQPFFGAVSGINGILNNLNNLNNH